MHGMTMKLIFGYRASPSTNLRRKLKGVGRLKFSASTSLPSHDRSELGSAGMGTTTASSSHILQMKRTRFVAVTGDRMEEWKRLSALDNDRQVAPVVTGRSVVTCPVCGLPGRFVGTAQTRGSDEAETVFMSCGVHRFRLTN